jgi:hypothetical protein
MDKIIAFIVENKVIILFLLFAISEGLSMIPAVKANGVFQLIAGWIKAGYDKFKAPAQA